MTWIALALLSSATYGVVAVVDKRLLDKHMPSMGSYFAWVGLATLTYGIAFLVWKGIPPGMPIDRLAIAGVSGLCWGAALALMFWGFKLQEVSRASAILFSFPVFVALFAYMFLGETLSVGQWTAMAVVVFGALLISFADPTQGHTVIKTNKYWNPLDIVRVRKQNMVIALLVLSGSSFMTAMGHLTGKYALQELSVWTVTSMGFLGTAAVLIYLVKPPAVTELVRSMRSKEAILLLILSEGILVPIAVVSMIAATKLGPISLVAALAGTRPIFIFLYSILLSMPGIRLLNESLDPKSLTVKLASVALIIGGITLL